MLPSASGTVLYVDHLEEELLYDGVDKVTVQLASGVEHTHEMVATPDGGWQARRLSRRLHPRPASLAPIGDAGGGARRARCCGRRE